MGSGGGFKKHSNDPTAPARLPRTAVQQMPLLAGSYRVHPEERPHRSLQNTWACWRLLPCALPVSFLTALQACGVTPYSDKTRDGNNTVQLFHRLLRCPFWGKKKDKNFPVSFNNRSVTWLCKPRNSNAAKRKDSN